MNTIEEFMEFLDKRGIKYTVEEIINKDDVIKLVYVKKSHQDYFKELQGAEFEPYVRVSKHDEPADYFYVRDCGWCTTMHYNDILDRIGEIIDEDN